MGKMGRGLAGRGGRGGGWGALRPQSSTLTLASGLNQVRRLGLSLLQLRNVVRLASLRKVEEWRKRRVNDGHDG